ncbi:MAG TPA: M14 family zinc carboxypeptidase [Cyclobacteriaceae bacterium]|nr:M14 family zinc carboxypeptidase [Cyclobacteriaceae bacterium]
MKKYILAFCLALFTFISLAQQQLKSPEEFLGYELGDRFTRHHRVVEYFQHVASVMPNVELKQYGETYELRPLVYAIISSPENFNKREEIRLDNLRRAGMAQGNASAEKIPIVWLSYNVHGNEASSIEASMKTLYELVNPPNTKTKEWLKNTLVIIDPCINPDGRDRYANFYNSFGNKTPNSSGDSREHREPWPGGRPNHYLFDLNRDWAWQTQIESQARIKVYNEWLPHIHVDFHEQGYNSPYYFAPAAEPFHEVITPWQREFQVSIGKNHAKYFDAEGWLYFTKERFDLYYPSYGDTYPTYNGAIGMTYEQAGHGFAGLSISTKEGDPLTLRDRIMHHHTTGLSTIEISSVNSRKLVDEFEKYFNQSINNPSANFKTYVIKASNHADKLNTLTSWLDTHHIQYGYAANARTTRGYDYQRQAANATVSVSTDDLIINVYQPKSKLITTFFEPNSKLPDSATYDITAWNLMYAYNLEAYALTERINTGKAYTATKVNNVKPQGNIYAYLFKYQSLEDVKFLAALHKNGIKVRAAEKAFTVMGERFEPGTLIVTQRNNESVPAFDDLVYDIANRFNRKVYPSTTGFVESGKDFGSGHVNFLEQPKVAILSGEQTSSLSFGETWHYFEQYLDYPVTVIGTDYFNSVNLSSYNVLIAPSGYYRLFDEETLKKVDSWVSSGGRLILTGNALNAVADKNGFALKRYANDEAKKAAEQTEKAWKDKAGMPRYEEQERNAISDYISGAIYKVSLDKSHPLAFGMGDHYYTLKTSEAKYDFMENAWNVGVLKGKQSPVQGFAGYRANQRLENSLVFGVQDKGRGKVIYFVDNPLFRNFWESGKMLFGNAVFMTQY